MEYEAFVKEFMDELHLRLEQEGIQIQRHEVTKNNGIVLDSLAVRYPESPVAPAVYLDDLYEMHKDGYGVGRLAELTAVNLNSQKASMPKMPVLTQESAREHLYCVVVNSAENAELLRNAPHETLEDLSVVARFKVGEDGSFLVTNEICKRLQMTSEEVMEAAHANTDRQEYRCQTMAEILHDIVTRAGMPEEYADELIRTQGDQCPMWVLSNASKVDGAAAITSVDAMKAAHERLGGDFYVLPSSRHEVILVPQSAVSDVNDLKSMVREVNATAVNEIDKLSDNVYRFDGRRLTIADSPIKSIGEAFTEGLSKGCAHIH